MTDKQPEALRLADAFGIPHWTGLPIALHVEAAAELRRLHNENETLRARLAQPEPKVYSDIDEMFRDMGVPVTEPVAWGIANTRPTEKNPLMMVMLDEPEPSHLVVPLYTIPPKREFIGLTDEEIKTLWDDHIIPVFNKNGISPFVFARAIEAKLREKNA